jgi:hypothetical protein
MELNWDLEVEFPKSGGKNWGKNSPVLKEN